MPERENFWGDVPAPTVNNAPPIALNDDASLAAIITGQLNGHTTPLETLIRAELERPIERNTNA
ncbi:hypothetical protein [Leucobacter chromiiresistens]|uniref:Uncharacterized protein n=1 Tax=Leucobacter chromiiresistens TaxID=1079994 RepID=A0A1H1BCW1_9MICO|nr:hypothetical protein [Leucobacter chromiiresistens]SDQ49710.1 hypothetical protein SAMN04488565_2735 [Leucobacter chromiiresistens]